MAVDKDIERAADALSIIYGEARGTFNEIEKVLSEGKSAIKDKDLPGLLLLVAKIEALTPQFERLGDLAKDSADLADSFFDRARQLEPPKNFFNQLKWARGLGDWWKDWRNNKYYPFEKKWIKR
jgi:hypothetical protein